MKRFWMVWRVGGDAPTYQHESELSATDEAHRLARNNPGSVFTVLEAITAVKRQDVVCVDLRTDTEIPF